MSKKYFIQTWGCAMNVADSQRVAGYYQQQGYIEAGNIDEADVIILTTCSVRKSAEDRVLGLVHNLSEKYKGKKKHPRIILTGCMLHYGIEKLAHKIPFVDEFLPISEIGFKTPSIRSDKHHAQIPISTGCNSFCAYCVVPLARGREKSRPESEILQEINNLIKKGYTEFTLLGQNVNSYGLEKVGMSLRKKLDGKKTLPSNQSQYKSFKGDPPFVKLLDKICAISQIKKVNFMSSNPWDFYDELIDCIARNLKINRELHIALQSGDDEILAKMNRGYTAKQYLALINQIRKKISQAEFTTDLIVGFPGETEAQFQNTVKLCQKIGFNLAYVNRYSPRPGTVSAKLYADNIHDLEKKRRWQILDKVVNGK
jgi:tRNA-2-methylthio-N6-dimethylallyladenosine synthase